jgi:hypothetical protein
MFPINPSYHGVNGTTTDAKLFGKFGVIGALISSSYLSNLFFSENDVVRRFPLASSALGITVHTIIFLSSLKKMLGIVTRRVITTMKHLEHCFSSIRQSVGNPVGTIMFSIMLEFAVALFAFVEGPKQTSIGIRSFRMFKDCANEKFVTGFGGRLEIGHRCPPMASVLGGFTLNSEPPFYSTIGLLIT